MTDLERAPSGEKIARCIIEKLNQTQYEILLRIRGDDWFPIQYEGLRSYFGWRTFAALGLAWPREPGMQTLSPLGKRVRDYIVMRELLA